MNAQTPLHFDVLVVDDDPAALEEMRDALVGAKLRVMTAESAAQALQQLRENDISVTVTDVRMSDITGMMLASLLRNELKANAPELIFISGYPDRDTVIESIRYSPSSFLLKPLDTEELLLAVFRALGVRKATRAGMQVGAQGGRASVAASPLRSAATGLAGSPDAKPKYVLELLHRERRVRERLFHTDIALTPAWQIILDLYRVEKQGGRNFASSIALSTGLSLTTALRHIEQLVAHGYVDRARDAADARRVRISLTVRCTELLQRYTDEVTGKAALPPAARLD